MSETEFIVSGRGSPPAERKSQPGSPCSGAGGGRQEGGSAALEVGEEGGPVLGLQGEFEGLAALGPPEAYDRALEVHIFDRSRRTLELRAAVVTRIETIAGSRRSRGRSPAQPRSRARRSSSVALLVGVSSDGSRGLSEARRRDRRNGLTPSRPSSTSQIASERNGRT